MNDLMKEILKVKSLNVVFGKEKVIKDLSFSVNKGEVLIILGPNGAGKTTLLRSLINLIPYHGEINWATKEISYLPPQELLSRKNLPPLTILEFFKMKSDSIKDIEFVIEQVGLNKKVLTKGFSVLSTGQFQRMLIAWALVNKPKVLLFDEPISGIDLGGKESIYSLLHKFWKEWGLTILLVTHELNIVWEHATNVLCLNKKGLCYGPPERTLTPDRLKQLYGAKIKFYHHRVNHK